MSYDDQYAIDYDESEFFNRIIKPLITELETMKEEIVLKGGYDIPESMMYD